MGRESLKLASVDGRVVEKLENLPGLYIDFNRKLLSGPIDALAAAARRLGISPPLGLVKTVNLGTWPKGVQLRDYQREGVVRLLSTLQIHGGALLADDMGLGKTRQTAVVSLMLAKDPEDRVLIACPASVRETWREELTKCGILPDQVAILGPTPTKKAKLEWLKAETCKYVVTSYDLLEKAFPHAFMGGVPLLVVLDEAHAIRGRRTKRSMDLQSITAMANYRLALTATPMWNRPRDFWKLLNILFGRTFGTPFQFDLAYCGGTLNEHGGVDNKGATNTEELKLRLSYYMVRREKKDVLTELPPLTRQVMWCDSNERARGFFQTAMARRQQGDLAAALEATLEDKIPIAMELAHQAKRFLLFTYRRTHAKQMAKVLADEGTPCVCIIGDMTTERRNAEAKLATSKGWGVVATIDSLSVGVNLQAVASTGIFHTIDYVPLKMAQAEARLHRMGQKDPVTWYYIAMKDTADELVVRTVVEKLTQWGDIMGKKGGTSELRDKLNAAIGVGEQAEKEALAAIYAAMEDAE